jgi:hypothetical protein
MLTPSGRRSDSELSLEVALDSVLRQAVLRNDHGVLEAYRVIYRGIKSDSKDLCGALRFGLLLGAELRRNRTVERAPKVSNKKD